MKAYNQESKKHIFSLYYEHLSSYINNSNIINIQDETIVHRIKDVLRLSIQDHIYLFDEKINVHVIITTIHKKYITVDIIDQQKNKEFSPKIILYLPLLRKNFLEDAIYNAAENGVSEIYLVKTEQSQKAISDHEFSRLQKIIIAACEQSKRFNIPTLKPVISLKEMLSAYAKATADQLADEEKIWFDPEGESLFSLCSKIHHEKPNIISILIGPEADFTEEEKKYIESIFSKYALTPTILRSVSAVTLSVGIIRSIKYI